jgi:adenine-specific DNA-methyltransferase
MCGTASIAEALRTNGYKVIASDIMTYAVHHARVRLTLDGPPLFRGLGKRTYYDVLEELDNLKPIEGLMFREYSPQGSPLGGHPPRSYFTSDNAKKIDAINTALHHWKNAQLLTEQEHSLLRHDLILAANKVANIAGTYGHFRSKWSNGARNPISLKPTEFTWGYSCDHIVMQGPAEELAPSIKADLCYLDPPYMKRQYAANYHLIETLARGDEPIAVGISGLRPWRDQYSDFCSKVRIRDAFRKIIGPMNCQAFLVSYSEDGLLSEADMVALLREYGTVKVMTIPFTRFRSNESSLGPMVKEYLFHLIKR